jgi:hypothetical protein
MIFDILSPKLRDTIRLIAHKCRSSMPKRAKDSKAAKWHDERLLAIKGEVELAVKNYNGRVGEFPPNPLSDIYKCLSKHNKAVMYRYATNPLLPIAPQADLQWISVNYSRELELAVVYI